MPTTAPTVVCRDCKEQIGTSASKKGVSCAKCAGIVHATCVGLDPAMSVPWICDKCAPKVSVGELFNMMVRFDQPYKEMVKEAQRKVNKLETQVGELKANLEAEEKARWQLEHRVNKLEQYGRRKNIIVTGVPPLPNETRRGLADTVEKLLATICPDDRAQVVTAHRLDHKREDSHVMAVLQSGHQADLVLRTFYRNKVKLVAGSVQGCPVDKKNSPIKLRENLSVNMQTLLKEVLQFKFEHKWESHLTRSRDQYIVLAPKKSSPPEERYKIWSLYDLQRLQPKGRSRTSSMVTSPEVDGASKKKKEGED